MLTENRHCRANQPYTIISERRKLIQRRSSQIYRSYIVSCSRHVTISVPFLVVPPKIVECSDSWRAAIGDGNIKFWCTFEANPVPDIKWMALSGAPNVEILPDGKLVDGLYSAVVKVRSCLLLKGNHKSLQWSYGRKSD